MVRILNRNSPDLDLGEHPPRRIEEDRLTSSPPVRGTPSPLAPPGRMLAFIPACAGNTGCLYLIPRPSPVHPRLCGEHRLSATNLAPGNGSSPPVRGTLREVVPCCQDLRFIPACAGNTPGAGVREMPAPVHPRLCGEHYSAEKATVLYGGSSPPVRGTPKRRLVHAKGFRFIPACAGNTSCTASVLSTSSVHPRLCGEHRTPVITRFV